MNLADYADHDATALAELVRRGEVTPRQLADLAMQAIAAVDATLNAVVETYPDRTEALDEAALGDGPFRGVPFLIKDVFGHEGGRKIELGSRLCRGMTAPQDTHVAELFRSSGLNIIGRTNAPEYSMSGTTENALYGNTSTPWREGYSAGGSSGGAAAAVSAGIVPLAHGSDIGGSIRIPASLCGGVGLKPSRGRVSFGPMLDEGGFGLSQNFVQSRTVRDTAVMLDWMATPQAGDPFVIPKPDLPYAAHLDIPAKPLRVGWTTKPFTGIPVDPEVAGAVKAAASVLAEQGHDVSEADPDFDGMAAIASFINVWFFGFDLRLDGYAKAAGTTIGPDTLEPVILKVYEHAKRLTPADFFAAMGSVNAARRRLGRFWTDYDIWLSPSTARVSEPFGNYNLGRDDVTIETLAERLYAVPCEFSLPHNLMGTPAISLPLALHSTGLPIGVQLAAPPAREDVLIQLAAMFEQAMPWAARTPPIHVSRA